MNNQVVIREILPLPKGNSRNIYPAKIRTYTVASDQNGGRSNSAFYTCFPAVLRASTRCSYTSVAQLCPLRCAVLSGSSTYSDWLRCRRCVRVWMCARFSLGEYDASVRARREEAHQYSNRVYIGGIMVWCKRGWTSDTGGSYRLHCSRKIM